MENENLMKAKWNLKPQADTLNDLNLRLLMGKIEIHGIAIWNLASENCQNIGYSITSKLSNKKLASNVSFCNFHGQSFLFKNSV